MHHVEVLILEAFDYSTTGTAHQICRISTPCASVTESSDIKSAPFVRIVMSCCKCFENFEDIA
jgi:hypothetical protein